jgi:hypothetical protein
MGGAIFVNVRLGAGELGWLYNAALNTTAPDPYGQREGAIQSLRRAIEQQEKETEI